MKAAEVIRIAKGPTKLGRALGLSHSTVLGWDTVPAIHVPAVSRLFGIPRHVLRPDLWDSPAGEPVGDSSSSADVAA